MKTIYIIALMYAVGITFLADGIGGSLEAIPAIGTVLGIVVAFCINATMGAGLLYLLWANDMYHPNYGSFLTVGGVIPGLDFLPFWLGLVVAGIVYDMTREGNLAGVGRVAQLAEELAQTKNPLSQMKSVMRARDDLKQPQSRLSFGAAGTGEQEQQEEHQSRSMPNLKSPSLAPKMGSDISPIKNQSYAKAA